MDPGRTRRAHGSTVSSPHADYSSTQAPLCQEIVSVVPISFFNKGTPRGSFTILFDFFFVTCHGRKMIDSEVVDRVPVAIAER